MRFSLWRLRFRLTITASWFIGFQKRGDMAGTEWLDILIIPSLIISFGWHWL